jgi:hypothetical protein
VHQIHLDKSHPGHTKVAGKPKIMLNTNKEDEKKLEEME